MLAGPDSTLETTFAAVADSIHALDAAADLDVDCTAADRKFFAARKKILAPLLAQLVTAKRTIEDHDTSEVTGSRPV